MGRKSRKQNTETQTVLESDVGSIRPSDTPEGFVEIVAAEPVMTEDAAIEAALAKLETADFVDHSQTTAEVTAEVPSDAEIEQALEAAVDLVAEETSDLETSAPDLETTEEAPPTEPSFADLVGAVSDEEADLAVRSIAKAVDDREDFEFQKNPENSTMARTLKSVRSKLVTKRAARVLLAAGVDEAFINRSLHDGTRYNVYALGKLADVVYGLSEGQIQNAINRACMKSLFQCRAAGIAFTGELARASASDKLRVEAAVRQHLMRHTVSASTAPTQASSTMQALQTLGIVKTEGTSRNPTYIVTDTPIARAFEKLAA